MCPETNKKGISAMIGYTYPVLHTGKRWFVDFFAMDPATNEMRRKRYYISDNSTVAEKKRRAAEIIRVLTKQLSTGWNPFVTNDNARGFVAFEECMNRYLLNVERKDRKKTRDSYRSHIKILREYNTSLVQPIVYCYQFDQDFCNSFLDWIYLDREVSPRTRNNYKGWLFGFAEYMIGRGYIKANPVEKIATLPEHEKFRKDL